MNHTWPSATLGNENGVDQRDNRSKLEQLPGIRETAAATILAESGPDMTQFAKPGNFSSWSGVAPGNNESAGVRKRAPSMKGNPHIQAALVESGWAASRTKDTEFQERYDRLKTRIGHKRAIVAAAHMLALQVYQVLSTQQPYNSQRSPRKPQDVKRLRRHHSRRLHTLDRWLADQQSAQ